MAVRLALVAQSVLDGGDRVGVERDGAGIGGLRGGVAKVPRAVPRVATSIAESIVSIPSWRSVHGSVASSARRAPDTAATRSMSVAAGSIDAAAAITARTSSSVITVRRWDFVDRSRARLATLVLTHPNRTACDRAARKTPCWFPIPASRMPLRRMGVCHRSTSPIDRRATGNAAIGSFLIPLTRLLSVARRRRRPGRQVLLDPRIEHVADHRPPDDEGPGPTSISAARRMASRLPPWMVLDSCVGRP